MEKIFLEIPTIDRKAEALEYLEENVRYNSDLNGTGDMDRCLDGVTYEEWLLELENRQKPEYVKQINRCLSKTFFVIRENDNKIIGMINIRYKISEEMFRAGASHIGYGIRPTERRKGYAKMALYLGLIEEQKLGEESVLLECTVDNIGSNKTIMALGGVLEKTELDTYDNEMTNYYYINVNDSIEKYYEQYNDYLKDGVLRK